MVTTVYNDRYESCFQTYITLCIYCEFLDPEELTNYLGILPSSIQIAGLKNEDGIPFRLMAGFYLPKRKLIQKIAGGILTT